MVRVVLLLVAVVGAGLGCSGSAPAHEPAAAPTTTGVTPALVETPSETSPPDRCVSVAPDTPTRCALSTHCGVGTFSSRVNGRWWVTDEGAGTLDYLPAAWGTYEDPPGSVTVVVTETPVAVLRAELNGHTVTYRPIPDSDVRGCA